MLVLLCVSLVSLLSLHHPKKQQSSDDELPDVNIDIPSRGVTKRNGNLESKMVILLFLGIISTCTNFLLYATLPLHAGSKSEAGGEVQTERT